LQFGDVTKAVPSLRRQPGEGEEPIARLLKAGATPRILLATLRMKAFRPASTSFPIAVKVVIT
jgi:hypothetical protein